MADWKQITARIRRARTGKDPAGQLSNLFQKTRDAMVAFELAKFFETSGQSGEAAKWYATAAERFRRQDWKTKAQEAATRLGTQPDTENAPPLAEETPQTPVFVAPEPAVPFEQTAAAYESLVEATGENTPADVESSPSKGREARPSPRGRGRRGGRNRRRGRTTSQAGEPAATTSQPIPSATAPPPVDESPEPRFSHVTESIAPRPLAEPLADSGPSSPRARYGDPGLSSRLTLLEMHFRRLLNCPPLKLNDGDRAPAGPGVFLLSDSDLTTNYYVEACQTLRVAIPGLTRGSGSRRGAESIKPQLAEHLGIPDTKVTKYLADHCVVRYLQLDQDASHFAHFVIAVLRPALNE
jgi:hypothetical protein